MAKYCLWSRLMSFMLVLLSSLLGGAGTASGGSSPSDLAIRYLELAAQGDAEGSVDLLADDFVLENKGWSATLGKEGLARALDWEVGAELSFTYSVRNSDAESVEMEVEETTTFMALLGFDPMRSVIHFYTDGRSRIIRMEQQITGGGATPGELNEKLEPIIEWAKDSHWPDLRLMIVDGHIAFDTRAGGEAWLKAIREYLASQGTLE